MKIEISEESFHEFRNFTQYFRELRPQYSDYVVYEVDAGEPIHLSLVLTAAKFDKTVNKLVGEPYDLIISKELFLEGVKKYYQKGLTIA
jgi:hypothetical protein